MMKKTVKMRGMKFLLAAVMTLAMAVESFAATGRIAFSDPTAKVGDDVSVTMKFSTQDGSALGDTKVTLAYDATALEYIGDAENVSGGTGVLVVRSAPMGASEAATALKFKALKAGTTQITVSDYDAYDNNGGTVSVEKQGNSTVTIAALETSSDDARLQSLQVSPGSLSPSFSPDVTEYSMTVGLDTADLTVSAVPANEKASVSVEGGTGLTEGENTVTVQVTAENGTSTGAYTITVNKTAEGGTAEETAEAEPEVLATLDVTAKKIRIIACPEDVEIPSGFKESSIAIGDTKVPGWTWAADESPRYCVFYGMNEAGEQNFYRYDLTEKTVQRYFDDQSSVHSDAEYEDLAVNYNSLVDDFNLCRIAAGVLLGLCVLLLILLIAGRKKSGGREEGSRRTDAPSRRRESRASGKSASGRSLSREERYMRGEEDEYEEEPADDAGDEPELTAESFTEPEDSDGEAPQAEDGGQTAAPAEKDDDFEFFDL